MADNKNEKGYTSSLNIDSNLKEVIGELQKATIEFGKLPSTAEEFGKALKKDTQLMSSFNDMLSAVPKTVRRLSELSKIELLPKKQLNEISESISKVTDSLQLLSSTKVFDEQTIRQAEDLFRNVESVLGNLEEKHSNIINLADRYTSVLKNISKTQKMLVSYSDKYTKSSFEVNESYNKVNKSVSEFSDKIKKANELGEVSGETISKFENEWSLIRKAVADVNDEQDETAKKLKKISSGVNNLLESMQKMLKSVSSSSDSISFGKPAKELEKMSNKLQEMKETGEYSNKTLDDYSKRASEIADKIEKSQQLYESINSLIEDTNKISEDTKDIESKTRYVQRIKDLQNLKNAIKETMEVNLDFGIDKVKEDLKKAQKDVEQTKSKIEELQKSSIKKQIIFLEINVLDKEIPESEKKVEELKKKLESIPANIDTTEMQNKVENSIKEVERLKKVLEELEIFKESDSLNKLQQAHKEQEKILEEKNKRQKDYNDLLLETNSLFKKEKSKKLEELNSDLNNLQSQLDEVNKKKVEVDVDDKKIDELVKKIEETKNSIDSIKSVSIKDENLEKLENELSNLQSQFDEVSKRKIEVEVDVKDEDVLELNKQIEETSNKIREIESASVKDESIKKLADDIIILEQDAERYREELEKGKNELSDYDSVSIEYQKTLGNLTNKQEEYNKALEEVTKQKDVFVSVDDEDLKKLKKELEELEKQLKNVVKIDVEDVKKPLQVLKIEKGEKEYPVMPEEQLNITKDFEIAIDSLNKQIEETKNKISQIGDVPVKDDAIEKIVEDLENLKSEEKQVSTLLRVLADSKETPFDDKISRMNEANQEYKNIVEEIEKKQQELNKVISEKIELQPIISEEVLDTVEKLKKDLDDLNKKAEESNKNIENIKIQREVSIDIVTDSGSVESAIEKTKEEQIKAEQQITDYKQRLIDEVSKKGVETELQENLKSLDIQKKRREQLAKQQIALPEDDISKIYERQEKEKKKIIELTLKENKLVNERQDAEKNVFSSLKVQEEELDKISNSIKLTQELEQSIDSQQKAQNDAVRLMNRLLSEAYEEVHDISNVELRKMFEKTLEKIQEMNNELKDSLMLGEDSNKEIRRKMGLLKNEGDKLRKIIDRQEELKRLDQESISSTVKKARELDKVNTAYAKQILSQKKNLGGLYDAFQVVKKNAPNKIVGALGENGLAASKILTGIAGTLGSFAGVATLAQVIAKFLELDKQVMGARKQILSMAADTNTAGSAFDSISHGGVMSQTVIENMREATEQWAWSLGVSMDQAIGYMKNFTTQGFSAVASIKNLEDMMGVATRVGMEVAEASTKAGELRSEFRMTLPEISSSFVQIQKDARNAGVTTQIFFDKVINAATGLGLYGKKIDQVSGLFSGLVKNMKLPEKAATAAAGNIAGSYSKLSDEMQITIFQLGEGKKYWGKSLKMQSATLDKEIEANKAAEEEKKKRFDALSQEEKIKESDIHEAEMFEVRKRRSDLVSQKQKLQNANKMADVGGQQMQGLLLDPMNQMLMQMQAVGKEAFGKGFNIEADIEKFDKAMQKDFIRFSKIGQQFGYDRETIIAMQNMVGVLANNSRDLKGIFADKDETKEEAKKSADAASATVATLRDVSSTTQRQQKLTEIFGKISANGDKKGRKKLTDLAKRFKEQFPELAVKLDGMIAAGNVNASDLAEVVSGVDVSLQGMSEKQTKDEKSKATKAAKLAGLTALKQTKSMSDVLENTLGRILRSIYTSLERLVNMFAWVFKTDLKGFDQLNDSILKDKESNDNLQTQINQQLKGVDIEIGMLNNEKEQTKEVVEKIKKLTEQKANLEKTKKLSEDFGTILNKREVELKKSGTVTDVSKALSNQGDEIAVALARQAKEVNKNIPQIEEVTGKQQDALYVESNLTEWGEKAQINLAKGASAAIKTFFTTGNLVGAAGAAIKEGVDPNQPIVKEQVKVSSATVSAPEDINKQKEENEKYVMKLPTQKKDVKPEEKQAHGGVVGGAKSSGDNILSALNSGELVLPESLWKNMKPISVISQKSLNSLVNSLKTDSPSEISVKTGDKIEKTINDNRVIHINVNQNDRRTVEQIVLNAIYSDKKIK